MTALVIGGNGQLGRHLRAELPSAEFWDRSVVDLADPASLEKKLGDVRPSAIINATAYTAVDKAESEGDLAWRVNAEAPAVMARAAKRLEIPVLHVSTDYVFDGAKAQGYIESDPVAPLGAYGRTKLGGELAIRSLCPQHWILRTAWVFSEHGNNFVKTMVRFGREREELRVVADQRGRPTYAGDLARCVAMLAAEGGSSLLPWGVHHVGGGAAVSWHQFAERIFARAAALGRMTRLPRVVPITTEQWPTPAPRPRNSLLLTQDATAAITRDPFDWERGLDNALTLLS